MSESLSFSLKKSDVSDSLIIRANRSFSKNERFLKKRIFLIFLTVFPPFYAKRANRSCRSSLSCSFLKIDGIDLLSSLFTKGRPRANQSCRSLKKRYGRNSLFFTSESLFRCFNHKTQAIRLKNRLSNL